MSTQQLNIPTNSSQENENNIPWGDSIKTKQQNTIRIYFQNVNGVQLHLPEKWENMIKTSMEELNSDIVGFCETSLNWKLPYIRKKLQQLNKKHLTIKTNITHSNNKAHSPSSFLPGGTLLATKGHWTGRIQEHLHDPKTMGRWTGTKYMLQQDKYLYVISGYRACKNSSSTKTLIQSNSTYAQQYYELKQSGIDTPHPRKQFVIDLIQYIHNLNMKDDDMLLLMLDANEQIGTESTGIINFITHGGLVDLFTVYNCSPCVIPTYLKGSSRIDYIFGTPNILPYIRKCGYLSFNSGIISDHRGLFIDLCTSLIDNKTHHYEAPIREIGMHSTMDQTKKYKDYILTQFEHHNIPGRAEILYNRASEQFSVEEREAFVKELNRIDTSITEIMLQAEKKVGKDPLYQSIRSQQIRDLQILLRYWQITVSGIKNEKDFSTVLETLATKLPTGLLEHIKTKNHTPTTHLIKTKEQLSQARKDQIQKWKEEEFAETAMIAAAKNLSTDSVQKQKRNTIKTKRHFSILRDRFKTGFSKGITNLIVPEHSVNDNETYRTVHDQQEIETLLIERNIAHFGQAQGSPFTVSPLVDKLGYKGTNNYAHKIIQGEDFTNEFHNMDGGIKAIMKILNNGENTPAFAIDINQDEFMSGFRKWREETATSPSGRHLGHYKALLRAEFHKDKEGDDQQKTTIKNKIGHQIFKTLFHITMATVLSGETLTRWAKVNSSMIEKVPGHPIINKLRVIHLYEADYNLLLKLLWSRRLTWKAHLNKTLHPSQAGSRPGRRAIDVVVYKEQKYLYSELTRTPLLTMDNDAKACYDRIICNLAMMASQYYGMPIAACKTQAKTLRAMEFHLRTAFGISEKFYKHSSNTPVHGSGQGSCASPTLWLILSSILMQSLEKQTSGMTIYPIQETEKKIKTIIDGFVDDTSLYVNLPFQESNQEQIFQKLREVTEKWSELISASGGKLELQKCFYYAMFWTFTQEGDAKLQTIAQQQELGNDEIRIRDPDSNKNIPVLQKECTVAHKTLGVYKTTVGDDSKQFDELLLKSKKLALLAPTAKMTRHQGRLAYNMIYIPTITYSLAACTFSKIQLEQIQAPALYNFLPAMGWNRTTSRAIIHGPEELGGINIPPLYAIHGASKIISMLTNIQAQTELGKLFVININWLQLVSGREQQLFQSYGSISYVRQNWLLHLKGYMEECSLTMKSKHFWVPKLRRQNDVILMDVAIQYTANVYQLKIINNWRIYFQALTLSDICDGHGNAVLQAYREYKVVNNHTQYRTSKLLWPKQGKPNQKTFTIWKKFLQNILGIQQNGMLKNKLGQWFEKPEMSDNVWSIYYDTETSTLCKYKNSLYEIYPKLQSVRLGSIFSLNRVTDIRLLPTTAIPATVTKQCNTSIQVSFQPHSQSTLSQVSVPKYKINNQEAQFEQHLQTQQQWIQDLCSNWESVSHDKLHQIFRTPTILSLNIVIAESSKFHMGGYGTILAKDSDILFQNNGKVMVTEIEEVSPRRLHLMGILSSLVSVRLLLSPQFFQRNEETLITVHTSMSPIIRILTKQQEEGLKVGEHISPDIDIILQIQQELVSLKNNKTTTIFKIIDKRNLKDSEEDKRYALLKQCKVAQSLAEDVFNMSMLAQDLHCNFPSNQIQLFWKSVPVHSGIYKKIITAYTSQALTQYMKETYKWNLNIQGKIWWKIHGISLQSLKPSARQIIQKFIFDYWATNDRESKLQTHRNANCERCQIHTETTDHVIQCETILNRQMWNEMLEHLKAFFKKSKTPIAMERCILEGLNAWLRGQEPPSIETIIPSASHKLVLAYKEQTKIGWGHFLRGRLSLVWANFINFEIEQNRQAGNRKKFKYKTAEEWGTKLIITLWTGIIKIWEERNKGVHKTYKDRGKSRDHEILKLQAFHDMEAIGHLQEDNTEGVVKTNMEIENMHPLSLSSFVKNMQKVKNWLHTKTNRERIL